MRVCRRNIVSVMFIIQFVYTKGYDYYCTQYWGSRLLPICPLGEQQQLMKDHKGEFQGQEGTDLREYLLVSSAFQKQGPHLTYLRIRNLCKIYTLILFLNSPQFLFYFIVKIPLKIYTFFSLNQMLPKSMAPPFCLCQHICFHTCLNVPNIHSYLLINHWQHPCQSGLPKTSIRSHQPFPMVMTPSCLFLQLHFLL